MGPIEVGIALTSLEDARCFALSLPETSEMPHFDRMSWRVNAKIFATVPPEPSRLNIFVDEIEVKASVEEDPNAFEELWWGKRPVGVRVSFTNADSSKRHGRAAPPPASAHSVKKDRNCSGLKVAIRWSWNGIRGIQPSVVGGRSSGRGYGGSVWESNPPRTGSTAPHAVLK